MVAYTVIYSSAAYSIHINYNLNVACVFHSCSPVQHFYDLPKFNLETCSEKTGSRYDDAVTCLRSPSYSV